MVNKLFIQTDIISINIKQQQQQHHHIIINNITDSLYQKQIEILVKSFYLKKKTINATEKKGTQPGKSKHISTTFL